MAKTCLKTVLAACFFLLASVAAQAVPPLISYQGQLNDQNGVPVNGTVSFIFSIYDVESGGTALWSEAQTVPVSNGIFNVQLGAVTPLDSSLFVGDELYLGIKAGADAEMTPRQRISSSAYSQKTELINLQNEVIVPVGGIVAWVKSMPGSPSLSNHWVECNGQVLNDPDSPFNGSTIPNLNGQARFLRGGNSSGSTGGAENHTHSLDWYGWAGGSGNEKRYLGGENSNGLVSSESSLPPYYSVVWIMRVK